jgi:ribosomal protein S20
VKSRIVTVRREADEAFAGGDKVKSEAAFRALCSLLDKAAKKRVIKKNTASRSKSRAHARLAAL